MGYSRAGFDVVGVDVVAQPHYPFQFVRADAIDVLRYWMVREEDWRTGFDAVHASPPCQGYSRMRHLTWLKDRVYPMLIGPVRELLEATELPWVIENVEGATTHPEGLREAFQLCGLDFGLRMYRHRHFEASWLVMVPPHQRHTQTIGKGRMLGSRYSHASAGVTGILPDPAGHTAGASTKAAAAVMGVDWMTRDEMTQAIPPAYTEFIGTQLLAHITSSFYTNVTG
jgi:DNA (cytosine-5)-methyltransferase 1